MAAQVRATASGGDLPPSSRTSRWLARFVNQENEPSQENGAKLGQNNIRDSLAKNQAKIPDENVKKEGFYDKNDDIPFYPGGKTLPTAAGVYNTLQPMGFRTPLFVGRQCRFRHRFCARRFRRAALACAARLIYAYLAADSGT